MTSAPGWLACVLQPAAAGEVGPAGVHPVLGRRAVRARGDVQQRTAPVLGGRMDQKGAVGVGDLDRRAPVGPAVGRFRHVQLARALARPEGEDVAEGVRLDVAAVRATGGLGPADLLRRLPGARRPGPPCDERRTVRSTRARTGCPGVARTGCGRPTGSACRRCSARRRSSRRGPRLACVRRRERADGVGGRAPASDAHGERPGLAVGRPVDRRVALERVSGHGGQVRLAHVVPPSLE